MTTLAELFDESGLKDTELAEKSELSITTIYKMKRGKKVSRRLVGRILLVLSQRLGRHIKLTEIEGYENGE